MARVERAGPHGVMSRRYVMSFLSTEPGPEPHESESDAQQFACATAFCERAGGGRAAAEGGTAAGLSPPGRQSRALRRGTDRSSVRGDRTAERVRDLLLAGRSERQAAEELGLSRRHVRRVWRWWVDRARAGPSPDEAAAVKLFVVHRLRTIVEESLRRIEQSPGYATAAIRGIEAMLAIIGDMGPSAGPGPAGGLVAEISASLRTRCGLLAVVPRQAPAAGDRPEPR